MWFRNEARETIAAQNQTIAEQSQAIAEHAKRIKELEEHCKKSELNQEILVALLKQINNGTSPTETK